MSLPLTVFEHGRREVQRMAVYEPGTMLPPLLHPLVRRYLSEAASQLRALLDDFGSPLHVVFPQIPPENAAIFRGVLESTNIPYRIFYPLKINKSEQLLRALVGEGVGAEVATVQELSRALAAGLRSDRVVFSSPAKNDTALQISVSHGVTIVLDALDEAQRLAGILAARPAGPPPVRVLARLNGLAGTRNRFGIPRAALPSLYEIVQKIGPKCVFIGFAFHLNRATIPERAEAITYILEEVRRARAAGLTPTVIDIGGAFPVSYVPAPVWEEFQRRCEASRSASVSSPFFSARSFVRLYPGSQPLTKGEYLTKLLATPLPASTDTVVRALAAEELELWIEPGRALLDQAGMTIFRVVSVKEIASGETVVIVEGNINHLSEQWFSSDFLIDPLVLESAETEGWREAGVAAIGGNTCIEMDMLSWRLIRFQRRPLPGDALVYVNTAAYQMDSNESSFHLLPIPAKVALREDGKHWVWGSDTAGVGT